MRISSQSANLYATASPDAETTSQALFGEPVRIIRQLKDWSEVQVQTDGYTGFLKNHHLQDSIAPNTHRVVSRSTPLFDQADIKSPIQMMLLLGSELALQETHHKSFLQNSTGHFVWAQHTRGLTEREPLTETLVETAQRVFIGSPYLWGGRSPLGLDCSALVQLSSMLHGWQLPRDTKDQVAFFERGRSTVEMIASPIEYDNRQANDLIYWPGHVAIMLDKDVLLHATAHSLLCCEETLHAVELRAGQPQSVWRLQTKP